MDELSFKLCDILLCLAEAVDIISPELNSHHQRVAYLAYRITEQMGLPKRERRAVLVEGLLHDIGALSLEERLSLLEEESETMHEHAYRSAKLISGCPPLIHLTDAVRFHHLPWDYGRGQESEGISVPPASHILHLADRVSVSIDSSMNVLADVTRVVDKFKAEEDKIFPPDAIQALIELSVRENIWLELIDSAPLKYLPESAAGQIEVDLDGVLCIAKVFSHIIDFRSHFTATHSAGVARTAEKLAELAGMSDNERKMMLIAGYLHDLGKLVIKDTVLEKPGKLNPNEYSAIRGHTFYTYSLLRRIKGFEIINQWASFHHERLDGGGYPFHHGSRKIPLGSRIMSVADIFNAITEHRPYRKGMKKHEIVEVMKSMAENGAICPVIVRILIDNLDLFIQICKTTQMKASREYEGFKGV